MNAFWILAVAMFAAAAAAASCPEGAQLFQDSACFYVNRKEKYSWKAALSDCAERGMQLASVRSQEEQDFIWGLAKGHYLWFGINDQLEEGDFIWSDGTAVDYTNWKSGEPDGTGDCTYMSMWSEGKWRDSMCEGRFGYVCRSVPDKCT